VTCTSVRNKVVTTFSIYFRRLKAAKPGNDMHWDQIRKVRKLGFWYFGFLSNFRISVFWIRSSWWWRCCSR